MTANGAERKPMFEIGGFRFCPNSAIRISASSLSFLADLPKPHSALLQLVPRSPPRLCQIPQPEAEDDGSTSHMAKARRRAVPGRRRTTSPGTGPARTACIVERRAGAEG